MEAEVETGGGITFTRDLVTYSSVINIGIGEQKQSGKKASI